MENTPLSSDERSQTNPDDFTYKILNKLRQSLLDLGRRNPLLNYKEKTRTISFQQLDLNTLYRKLVNQNEQLTLIAKPQQHLIPQLEQPQPPASPPRFQLQTEHEAEELSRRGRKLINDTKIAAEETGNHLLFLALGFLQWYESDRSEVTNLAPLLLIPVDLKRVHQPNELYYEYLLAYCDEDIETNPALIERLRNDFSINLPLFNEYSAPQTYLQDLKKSLQLHHPRWQVLKTAYLDCFSFTKLLMYKDLDDNNWPPDHKISNNPHLRQILSGHLQTSTSQSDSETATLEETEETEASSTAQKNYQPALSVVLNADSSQQAVIDHILTTEQHLVVEGPPGTGKSQTIANIIALALAQGKSVLFVADKQAALEVVRTRLDSVNLGLFCLELHSHKTQKKQIHKVLQQRLEANFPSVAELEAEITTLKQQEQQLQAYSSQMEQRVGWHGEKIYEVFWKVERLRSELGDDTPRFVLPTVENAEQFTNCQDNLQNLVIHYQALPPEAIAAWTGFTPRQLLPGDEYSIGQHLSSLIEMSENYLQFLQHYFSNLEMPLRWDLELFLQLAKISPRQLQVLKAEQVLEIASQLENSLSVWQRSWLWLKSTTARTLISLKKQLPSALFNWLCTPAFAENRTLLLNLLDENQNFIQLFYQHIQGLEQFSEIDTFVWFNCQQPCHLAQIIETCRHCSQYLPYLSLYATFQQSCRTVEQWALTPLITALIEQTISPKQLVAQWQYAIYYQLARELLQTYPHLQFFNRNQYENLRKQFAALDKKIMAANQARLAWQIAQRPIPEGNKTGKVSDYSQLNLIFHELNKKTRHIPIRQLIRRATQALQALKPCFMMSPMSVAQYLVPGEVQFDLLVIDEASQVKPQDALGAIARCRQLVIVGDPKQLPPTKFFSRIEAEETEEEENPFEGQESILDKCLHIFPQKRLKWHYRSAHESLIAFSNHYFYDDELVVFPAPYPQRANYGVHHHYVDQATYLKGKNLQEAQAVIAAVVEHFKQTPFLSLGVATFNSKQQELISELLDKACQEESWLEHLIEQTEEGFEPFFIKNLENIQGDERDVIFISTTYGPDPTTKRVYQRFGPITQALGWRRLNVIFTRAKKSLVLFTSMRANDIQMPNNQESGVWALKFYLEYAEKGYLPEYGHPTGRQPDSDFERAVAKILEKYGYQTVPQVGVAGFRIDIGVCHPQDSQSYILGIECDGASYHTAQSVRDRDRLRQEILESKGWRIHRIWSTDWFKNRDLEVKRLLEAIEKALLET